MNCAGADCRRYPCVCPDLPDERGCIVQQVGDREWWCHAHERDAQECGQSCSRRKYHHLMMRCPECREPGPMFSEQAINRYVLAEWDALNAEAIEDSY